MWFGRTDWVQLACRYDLCPNKFLHRSDHLILLGTRELGEHRQGNDFSGNTLRRWKIPGLITEVLIGLLLMERNWIVNASTDPGLRQTCLQHFSVLYPYDIEVINTLCPRGFQRQNDGILHFRKQLMIAVRKIAPRFIPLGKMREFHRQPSRLNRVQTAVVALDVVVILLRLAVVANHLHP